MITVSARTLAAIGPLLAAAAGVPARAQGESDGAPSAEAESAVIVVTGRGLPDTPATPAYSTERIGRDALLATGSGRIEDALSSIAGFQQFRRSDSRSSNPTAQGATLRALGGNAASRALVLLDGVPMADPFFGSIPFSALAPERLAAIRVTRGGGSGPFGAGALAGTIELDSAGREEAGSGFAGQALVNDRGETELSASAAPALGAGFATLSGRWDRGQGFFTAPPDQRGPASVRARYDAWSVQARAVAPLGASTELQARVLVFRDDRTLRFAGADTAAGGEDASIRIVGRGALPFDLVGYVQARDFSTIVVSATALRPVTDQRGTPATGIGGKLELRPLSGPRHVLRLGADYRQARGRVFETGLSAATGAVTQRRTVGGVTSDLGLFAENDVALGAITLTAGIRADRYAIRDGFLAVRNPAGAAISSVTYPPRSGWEGSLRGGIVARPGSGWRLRAAAYSGLRLPTLNELYRPFSVFPVVTQANSALENERLAGYEAGADYAPSDRVDLSITVFDNRVANAIANVTLATNLRQRRNIDAIHARGIEAGGSLVFNRFQFEGSLALTDAVARGTGAAAALDGKRPAQTPRISASASARWRPAQGAQLALTLRHTGAQFEDDQETDLLPPATTLDLFAQWPLFGRLSAVVRGENLTDTAIVTRDQAGSIDLGTPRTLWAGIRVGY